MEGLNEIMHRYVNVIGIFAKNILFPYFRDFKRGAKADHFVMILQIGGIALGYAPIELTA